MRVYGALVLREDHSVDPKLVTVDGRHGCPFIDLDGDSFWPHVEREDIIGFGQEELGDEAHILVVNDSFDVLNGETEGELVLDDLESIRDFFCEER